MPEYEQAIREHLGVLKSLQAPTGLFVASPQGVSTGYDKAWLRDNFYMSLAFERVGDWETARGIWRAILDVLLKHEYKIDWAAKEKPHASWQYIHARYHPETFEEFWEEWGNKQNDAVGAVLFKLADLETRGHGILATEDDKRIVQKLVDYLNTVQYWNDPDSGMWEEGEELHASSIGACVAALKMTARLPYVKIPEGIIEKGEAALKAILPRESKTKFADLALLSLIYPYDVVSPEVADEIIENVEYHYARRKGVIRYKNDRYYNKNVDGVSEEAEWTMGLAWLVVIHKRRGNAEKAKEYLNKARGTLTPEDKIPELYYSNSEKPNENIPLGWAESMFIIALAELNEA